MTLLKLFNCSNWYISVPIHSHHHKLHKLNEHFEDTHDILYQTQQIINIIIYLQYYTKNNGDFTTYDETFNNPMSLMIRLCKNNVIFFKAFYLFLFRAHS